LTIEDRLENILSHIVAASKRAHLYPYVSEYLTRAFGGPYIKISGARCT
jgi:predicted Zn-dependent protease